MKNELISNQIQKFITQQDMSIQCAQEIEHLLNTLNLHHDLIFETILMLASYRPSGGEFFYNEEQIIEQLNKVLDHIKEDAE